MKRRTFLKSATTLPALGLLSGCGDGESSAQAQWEEIAALDTTETPDELYQKALQEDTLVVYSVTTRIYDVKDSFEAQYPGLTVEVYDMRAYDMVDALLEEYETDKVQCDVVICSDDDGRLTGELLPQGVIYKYLPADIAPFIIDEANTELLYFVGEAEQLFYNDRVYDTCPIDNWWALTEPEWYGNVYMNSPLRSQPAYALLNTVIANSDAMADAYLARYGTALEVPEDSCAGKIFWEMLVANGVGFTTSSNEIVELVGAEGTDNPPLGFMISSKIRRTSIGLDVAVAYGAAPCDGVYSANSVSIAGQCTNISAAKLFVRWLMGETDDNFTGMLPYLLEGTWSVRTDVDSDSAIQLADGNFWFYDKEQLLADSEDILAFWDALVGE